MTTDTFTDKFNAKLAENLAGTDIEYREGEGSPSVGVPMSLEMASFTPSGDALRVRTLIEDKYNQNPSWLDNLVPNPEADIKSKVEWFVDNRAGQNPESGQFVYLSDELNDEDKSIVYYLEPQTKGYKTRKFAAGLAQEIPVLAGEVIAGSRIARGRGVFNLPNAAILAVGAVVKQIIQRVGSGEEVTAENLLRSGTETAFDTAIGFGVLGIGKWSYNRKMRKLIEDIQAEELTGFGSSTATLQNPTVPAAGGAAVIKETSGEFIQANPNLLDEADRVQDLAKRPVDEGGIDEPLTPDQLMGGPIKEAGDLLRNKGATGQFMDDSVVRQQAGAESLFVSLTGQSEEGIYLSAKEIQEAAANFIKNQKTKVSARIKPYYKDAYNQSVPEDALQSLVDWATNRKTEILAGFSKATSPINKLIKDLTEEVLDESGKKTGERVLKEGITVRQIHSARQEIDRTIDYDKVGGMDFVLELRREFDKVLKAIPEFRLADEKAAFRLEYIAKLEKSVLGQISEAVGEQKAKTIFNMLFKQGNISPTALTKFKLKIIKTNPEAWNKIVRAYFADTLDTVTTSNVGGEGNWVGKLYSQLWGNKKRRAIIKAMLDEDSFKAFEEMMDIFGALRTTPAVGSKTFSRQDFNAIIQNKILTTTVKGKVRKQGWLVKILNVPAYRKVWESWVIEGSEKEMLESMVNIWLSPNNIKLLKQIASTVPESGKVPYRVQERNVKQLSNLFFVRVGVGAEAAEQAAPTAISAIGEAPTDDSRRGRFTDRFTRPRLGQPNEPVGSIETKVQDRSGQIQDYAEKYPSQVKTYQDGIQMQNLERRYPEKLTEALRLHPYATILELKDHLVSGKQLGRST